MTEQEQRFVDSVRQKIKQYKIPVSIKDAFNNANKKLTTTKYTSGVEEVVDTGIEWYLCSMSPGYFIDRYCYISVPNMGIIPFGMYYFQREVMRELSNYKKYVFLKTRQCLTEDNFVMTNRGYVSIKDVKIGDKIETIIDGKSSFVGVLDSFYTGEKETCKILTNSGLAVECTLDHKIFTKRGWVEAGNLTINDEIVSLLNKGSFGDYKLDKDDFAAFIGYYLADGKYSQPCFVNTNIEYVKEMSKIGLLFENCSSRIAKRIMNDDFRKQSYDVFFTSKSKASNVHRPIRDFMDKFGLNIKSEERCLTKELMNLNEHQMSILLNRLFAGDGWITHKKDNRRKEYIQYEIGIGSPCFKLIKQLEYILQTKYNIHCYVGECFDNRNPNGKRFWKLRISQKKSVIDFIRKIGIKGKTDTEEITNLISKERPYKTNQSFEKIRSITHKTGTRSVYDITTESSDFLANGLLVHNCGISTAISFYCLWRCLFRTSESIAVVSKSKDAAQAFVSKIKITLTMLPPFLNVPLEVDNMSHLVFKNTSEIKSEARSPNAGRSATLSLLVLDEAAFYGSENMARQIVGSAQPTLTRTGGSLIIISTPNGSSGEGSYYFEQVDQLRLSGNTEREKLVEIDWFEVPDFEGIFPQKGFNQVLNKYIAMDYFNNPEVRKEMRSFFSPIELSWKTNPWLKAQHDDLNDALFLQEVMHNFVIMGNSVFGNETMDKMKANVVEPILTDRIGDRVIKGLWIWKKPEPKHRYIAGIDVAKGSSLDSSAIEVLDAETYEQVAEYSAHVSTPEFARIIKVVANYYNQAYTVIECNGIGEAVFNGVYHDQVDPYNNLYKQKLTRNGITVITGWITDVKTRQLITNQLIDWFNVDELFVNFKVHSSRVYTQMGTWIWGSGNRPDHADGCVSGDTIITCIDGFKQIKDVNVGDFVLTHTGTFKKVVKTFKFKDENKKMLDVSFFGKQKLKITSNHKLYLNNDNKNDFICFDDIYEANKYKSTSMFSLKEEKIKDDIYNNDLFLFFIGHVLSDGSVSLKNAITITSHKDECDYVFDLYKKMFNSIGIDNIKVYEYKNFKRLYIRDKNLYNMLKDIGVKTNKDVINDLRYINHDKQMFILFGYIFGDGCLTNKRTGKLTMNSVSYKLSYFIQSILFRNGLSFNISKVSSKRYNKKENDQYSITILGKEIEKLFSYNHFEDIFNYKNNYKNTLKYVMSKNAIRTSKLSKYENNILVNNFHSINKIEWDDYYYDLMVEEDHSYVANGIVVHNSHDDNLIALALAIYNRDKAINAGESFIVGEDGRMIDYSVNDRLTSSDGKDNKWDFLTSEDEESRLEAWERKTGMDKEHYDWLVS